MNISSNRLEAFSDGIIVIIITIMVFDLKIPLEESLTSENFWKNIKILSPKFISYTLSFFTLAIMWVNHHQIFHQITKATPTLLWLNIFLLFLMSLIPLATTIIGSNPFLVEAVAFYAFIFWLNALAFLFLRKYALPTKTNFRHYFGIIFYFLAVVLAFFDVYFAFFCVAFVPIMYFVPEKINQKS